MLNRAYRASSGLTSLMSWLQSEEVTSRNISVDLGRVKYMNRQSDIVELPT